MTAQQLLELYLEKLGRDTIGYTILVCKAAKDERTPFFHPIYERTPIWHYEKGRPADSLSEYHCLNCDQMPIDWECGVAWRAMWENDDIVCFAAIKPDEMAKLYSERQAKEIIDCCDEKIREKMERL